MQGCPDSATLSGITKSRLSSRKTVLTILNGGLGNQMFQFAIARAIACRNNAALAFEISAFRTDRFYQRNFSLMSFRHPATVPTSAQPIINKIFTKLRDFRQSNHLFDYCFSLIGYIERTLKYDANIIEQKPFLSHIIVGYWQDERYFCDYRDILLNDFLPTKNFSPANCKIKEYIDCCETPVAVHVRYNHEVKSDDPNAIGERRALNVASVWVGAKYYNLALQRMCSKVQSPSYIVFSDNPSWVKKNLPIFKDSLILEQDRGEDWEDIMLMARCKHHIIANSSFSWWGAWLCKYSQKVVIAPKDYLYTPAVPDEWVSIDLS
jgi:hypothetical protein